MSINKEQMEMLEDLDQDRPDRYNVHTKWYPEREHKTDKMEGPVDCMGDESFYKPSRLGNASAEPDEVAAGDKGVLKLRYYCGSDSIAEGTSVRFYMRGQAPLGEYFQIDTAAFPGNVEIHGPGHCKLEPVVLGFKVISGCLKEGDLVEVIIGKRDGFNWTRLAGRYEFKVVFNYGEGRPERRLPVPVVINVRAGEVHHLEGTLPCTIRNREKLRVHITARDQFDNRAELNDDFLVKAGDKVHRVQMVKGIAEGFIKPDIDSVNRLEITNENNNIRCLTNACTPSEDYHLFIGDLHVHDFLSEAHQYTDKVYEWAIDDRNLDFVSVSIQTHGWIDNEKWSIVKYMNERYLEEGRFVTLLANEWQHSAFGDKVIHYLGGDQPFICVDDPRYNSSAKVYETLRSSDAVVISHHSSYPAGSWCSSTNFDAVETDVERLTELWSMHGSSEGFDLNDRPLKNRDPKNTVMDALRKGLRIGFTAGSDTHSGRPGGSIKEPFPYWGGLVAVWAEALTRKGIFEALKARRTYALTGARINLKMTVNDEFMGSEIPASATADIKIDVWAQSKIKKVQLIKNTLLYKEFEVNKDEYHLQLEDKTGGPAFYHCRVIQEDGHLAVCSPVWVG